MRLSLFNYCLPQKYIAQKPIKPRDHSRLMILDKKKRSIRHDYFYNLDKYLTADDILVFNNSKVFPARIRLDNGGEIFLLQNLGKGEWESIGRKLKENNKFQIINNKLNFKYQILKKLPNGNWLVKFNCAGKKFKDILEKIGETPLPPYIKSKDSKKIRQNYQTLFAKHPGSVAAPTAGFHFTKKLLSRLEKKGVKIDFVTLHVGLGTFQPVKTANIEDHPMHPEMVIVDKVTAHRLNRYKQQGKRIIAVGTTSCRTLESLSNKKNQLQAGSRLVNIFIYPSYNFKFIDGLITNFHLPKSTLLMLVSSLAGRKFILKAYQEAVKKKYRFYSFGDGMLIK